MQGGLSGFPGVAPDFLPLERLYRWERERPQALFLTQPSGGGQLLEWTWAEAADEARRMAAYLKSQNWPPGSHVAILSRNCAWWIMADLAIWMAGHVTIPVYASLRPSTVRQILEHSEAKACFVGGVEDAEAATVGIPPGVEPIRFPNAPESCSGPDWKSLVAGAAPIAGQPVRAADEIATIFYTSGTTGAPKGVMQRFGAFSFLARLLTLRLDLSGEHRILSYLPLAHILERAAQEVPAILLAWHVYFAETQETFLTDLRRARPTAIFPSVPRLLLKFQQGVFEKVPKQRLDWLLRIPLVRRIVGRKILRELGLDALRYAACGSAPLTPELLLWYRDLGLNLLEGYGLTEGLITHLTKPGNVRAGYVGAALDGVEAKRADNGELLLKSPMNMAGYYKDPPATRAAFTDEGFLRTGDLVEIEADGNVRITGRLKEQFKTSKGKYVAPAPIEARLLAHPGVESCCLMGAGLAAPFAVVVLDAATRKQCADPGRRRALEESLGARLAETNAALELHERVAFIAIVDEPWTIANGMITPTLKLRRASVEERYLPYLEAWRRQNRPVIWESEEKTKQAGGVEATG